jgi:hypothetical protein
MAGAREAWESERQKGPKPRLDYGEIKRRIEEKGRNVSIIYWSKGATDEEMAQLAGDALAETDCDRLRGFLRMFQLRKFPGPVDRLIELARGSHEGVARAAMNALSHFSDPAVRKLALETAQKREWRGVAFEMLIRNREPDDYRLLERLLEEQLDPDDYHDLGIGMRHFVTAHRSEDALRSLLLLYENEPCSLCRHGAVEELIAINRLPQWALEECRYDAYSETRKLATAASWIR